MAISIDVVPNFSAFVNPTAEEIAVAVGCDEVTALAFLDNFVVLPKAKVTE